MTVITETTELLGQLANAFVAGFMTALILSIVALLIYWIVTDYMDQKVREAKREVKQELRD